MALHKKWSALTALHPDVAVVPESADPASAPLADVQRDARSRCWVGPHSRKGLAAFSFGDHALAAATRSRSERADAMVATVSGPSPFTLVAVWARAPRYVEHLHDVLDEYAPLLGAGDVVLAGDFNSNTIWDRGHGPKCHSALVRRLATTSGW
jgi:exodeoxyribonuclease III